MKSLTLFVCIFVLNFSLLSQENFGNKKISSFSKSKEILQNQIFKDHQITFYCKCNYDDQKNIDLNSCDYKPKKESKKSKSVEWEHIVPADNFGKAFKEWESCTNSKGKKRTKRECARRNDLFKLMEADMYNLVPAVGELNQNRSNHSMSMIEGEKREYGNCDIEIEKDKIEPPKYVRGDIARVYMYMQQSYPGINIISGKNKKLFEAWDSEDPVDKWECEKTKKIEYIQKNENKITKSRCQKAGLW